MPVTLHDFQSHWIAVLLTRHDYLVAFVHTGGHTLHNISIGRIANICPVYNLHFTTKHVRRSDSGKNVRSRLRLDLFLLKVVTRKKLAIQRNKEEYEGVMMFCCRSVTNQCFSQIASLITITPTQHDCHSRKQTLNRLRFRTFVCNFHKTVGKWKSDRKSCSVDPA